jgi:hypothetical protein
MKKIYNIIDSELIRTNHRLRQEFGEVGTSESISADGTTTIFTTKAVIRDKLRYSKWSCLNRRVHYVLGADKGTVRISNVGLL